MKVKLKRSTCVILIFTVICAATAAFSYSRLLYETASVTEAALSLCADEIRLIIDNGKDDGELRNYLAFVKIEEKYKNRLLAAVQNKSDGLLDLCDRLQYFDYGENEMQKLRKSIAKLDTGSITVLAFDSLTENEERADKFVLKLFSRSVAFRTEKGDGTVYVKRYYCGNICVDLLSDGSMRYLCDITPNGGTDPLPEALFKGKDYTVVNSTEFFGMTVKQVQYEEIDAEFCIDNSNGRIIAAKFNFK